MRKALGVLLLGSAIVLTAAVVISMAPSTAAPAAAASASPLSAYPQMTTPDEAGALITACGAPREDVETPMSSIGQGVVERKFRYPKAEYHFAKDPLHGQNWTMTGAFPASGDDAMSRDEAKHLMPCVAKVKFSNAFF